ncbi:MAG: hypothetical protein QXO40_00040 [Candidatus Aenigmatarchaeota archaeon]
MVDIGRIYQRQNVLLSTCVPISIQICEMSKRERFYFYELLLLNSLYYPNIELLWDINGVILNDEEIEKLEYIINKIRNVNFKFSIIPKKLPECIFLRKNIIFLQISDYHGVYFAYEDNRFATLFLKAKFTYELFGLYYFILSTLILPFVTREYDDYYIEFKEGEEEQ